MIGFFVLPPCWGVGPLDWPACWLGVFDPPCCWEGVVGVLAIFTAPLNGFCSFTNHGPHWGTFKAG
jgi:hypothetical protein